MIFVVIKANTIAEAISASRSKGIILTDFGWEPERHTVSARVSEEDSVEDVEMQIISWFCKDSGPCELGKGFPNGTLLHYSGIH